MANDFYTSKGGVNWENVANLGIQAGVSGLATGGVGALVTAGTGLIKGLTSSYFNKKSEKRAWERYLNQLQAEYEYAQRYAENSPSWTVKGLRDAGINPMLAFGSQAPTAPSVGSHSINPTNTDVKGESHFDPMTLSTLNVNQAQIRNLDNQGKAALENAKTNRIKAQSDIRKNDAETALRVLEKQRFENGGNYDNPTLRDARQVLDHALDSFGSTWDYLSDSPTSKRFDSFMNYIKHGPRPSPTDINVRRRMDSLFDDITKALSLRGLDKIVRPHRYKKSKGSFIYSR